MCIRDRRLSDVPPGGIWIRLLGSNHGKSVYRLTVQTRFQGAYDMAVNVNHDLDPEQVGDECEWLVVCSGTGDRPPLVEEFGGYWPDQDLWTEEFIPGETLDRVVPGAAELVTHTEPALAFPSDIESTSLSELGEIPITPLEDAIAQSVALYRERLDAGQLDPAQHGL